MGILDRVIKSLFGDPHEKRIRPYWPMVEKINQFETEISALSDADLKNKTSAFKEKIQNGTSLDDLLPEAFAVVREASKRVLNMRHFDVQLVGGIVLHEGKIAEMKTGEGKTLVSTLPAYLNALEGKGVYVVTVNDYLAKRDSEWMGKLFEFLGLSVGLIQSNMHPQERLAAYQCDITYGTNNEFGFDYLRDNLAYDIRQVSQIRRHYAIVDEVDSILIDEARTPLIISGPVEQSPKLYMKLAKTTSKMAEETHFVVEEKHKNISLTEEGIEFIESTLKLSNIYSVENMQVAHIAVQCLKARHLFKKDVDYVVKDGEVLIVDEFTGRILDGRRYSDGLHQAIEAIEGLHIKEESQTLASITFQNYFRMFPKLAGMTGTAETEEAEFGKIYGLEVVVIPTNRELQRQDMADIVYKTKKEKYNAICNVIKEAQTTGQPILVGTISIEASETLSTLLKSQNIKHNVLNAKYHEKEAEIVKDAGEKGAVTIATNMAGRGTDIKLGEGVKELGGLFIVGSERHESRRIDNQLRGRSGRQGDPGKSRFFVSLEDDLMRLFGSDRIAKIMETLGLPDDTPIEHSMVTRSIEKAQEKVEKYHFGVRKQVLQFDDVANKQRETIYEIRHQILSGKSLDNRIQEFIGKLVDSYLETQIGKLDTKATPSKDEILTFSDSIAQLVPIRNLNELAEKTKTVSDILTQYKNALFKFYEFKKQQFPENFFEEAVTRQTLMVTLDRKWKDHLHNMDVLREGIGLRAYGQMDPLIEYKVEAYKMFSDLMLDVSEESLDRIFKAVIVDPKTGEPLDPSKITARKD